MKRFSKKAYRNIILFAVIIVILANGSIQTVSSINPITLWAFACFSYAAITLIGSLFAHFYASMDNPVQSQEEDFLF